MKNDPIGFESKNFMSTINYPQYKKVKSCVCHHNISKDQDGYLNLEEFSRKIDYSEYIIIYFFCLSCESAYICSPNIPALNTCFEFKKNLKIQLL